MPNDQGAAFEHDGNLSLDKSELSDDEGGLLYEETGGLSNQEYDTNNISEYSENIPLRQSK